MAKKWVPKNFDEVCKRAAGRRRYQAERRYAQDERQLVVLTELLRLEWRSYGFGRILAKNLSVDAATISRDIHYLRSWREGLIESKSLTMFAPSIVKTFGGGGNANREMFADTVLRHLVEAHIHPRLGFSCTVSIRGGITWMTVSSARR